MNRRSVLSLLPAAFLAALLPRTRSVEAAAESLPVGVIRPNTSTLVSSGNGWDRNAWTVVHPLFELYHDGSKIGEVFRHVDANGYWAIAPGRFRSQIPTMSDAVGWLRSEAGAR